MAFEKHYTARQAAEAVLKKAEEVLKKSELLKGQIVSAPEVTLEKSDQTPPDGTQKQQAPEFNPKEQQEGNNPGPGTNPQNYGEEYGDCKGHIKLAKWIGRMEQKRKGKQIPNG